VVGYYHLLENKTFFLPKCKVAVNVFGMPSAGHRLCIGMTLLKFCLKVAELVIKPKGGCWKCHWSCLVELNYPVRLIRAT